MKSFDEAIRLGLDYLARHGRALEQALADFYFSDGGLEAVIHALAEYQNEDGGFGKALEPDFRCPDSSILATSEALIHVRQAGISFSHPMAAKALQYLINTYQSEAKGWHFTPPEGDAYPHAPWWFFNADAHATRHNPRPQLLGDLFQSPELVPSEMLESLTVSIQQDFLAEVDALQQHDLFSYLRLYHSQNVPDALKACLHQHLPAIIRRNVAEKAVDWAGYVVRPYQAVKDMHDPFLPLVANLLPAAIQYLMDEQQPEGNWLPNWSWGELYPEDWETASVEWQSHLTLANLLVLKNFKGVLSS